MKKVDLSRDIGIARKFFFKDRMNWSKVVTRLVSQNLKLDNRDMIDIKSFIQDDIEIYRRNFLR